MTRINNFLPRVTISFLLLLCSFSLFGQNNAPLTAEQKTNDFDYFYSVIESNYPFLHVSKRVHGVDWLANKERYLQELTQTTTDSAYIFTLQKIISELHDGHVSFNPTRWRSDYLKAYQKFVAENSKYHPWVDVLSGNKDKVDHWAEILLSSEEEEEDTNDAVKPQSKVTCRIVDGDIAIMKINTFSTFMVKRDSAVIADFFNSISNCKALIIDIQENGGGDETYWEENLVKPLITKPIVYNVCGVIKDGELNRQFYSDLFAEARLVSSDDILGLNLPPELLTENYYVKEYNQTFTPNAHPIDFNGRIFLATSDKVFSASESFAGFCKSTGWATLIGEPTGGDGAGGTDPIIVSLTESGILITVTSTTGLNPDGSFNAETKTQPDIVIEAANSSERMDRIIDYMRHVEKSTCCE